MFGSDVCFVWVSLTPKKQRSTRMSVVQGSKISESARMRAGCKRGKERKVRGKSFWGSKGFLRHGHVLFP